MEYGGAAAASIMREFAAREALVARSTHIVERGAKKEKKLRNLREYMNDTCREHEARVCGACSAHSVKPKQICGISDRQFVVACGACM
jgi:hypothetical protein